MARQTIDQSDRHLMFLKKKAIFQKKFRSCKNLKQLSVLHIWKHFCIFLDILNNILFNAVNFCKD